MNQTLLHCRTPQRMKTIVLILSVCALLLDASAQERSELKSRKIDGTTEMPWRGQVVWVEIVDAQ